MKGQNRYTYKVFWKQRVKHNFNLKIFTKRFRIELHFIEAYSKIGILTLSLTDFVKDV